MGAAVIQCLQLYLASWPMKRVPLMDIRVLSFGHPDPPVRIPQSLGGSNRVDASYYCQPED